MGILGGTRKTAPPERPRELRADGSPKPRVLYFIVSYPTFSETYMHEEIRSLRDQYEIRIVTYKQSPTPRRDAFPYEVITYKDPCLVYGKIEQIDVNFRSRSQRAFLRDVGHVIEEFQPDVLHAHYFGLSLLLAQLSEQYGVPFTVRTHSMDVLSEPDEKLAAIAQAANSDWCQRVLAFPANRQRLTERGLSDDKVVDCWPVLNFERFYRPEPRAQTKRIMCAGPAISKKSHYQFVELGVMLQDAGLSLDLYADGPAIERTRRYNEERGNPIQVTYADPDDMPDVYPRYDWIVYPSDPDINKVGLPVALAEALASGIGICWQELPGRRDEQLEFLGGAGHLFQSIDEVPAIIAQPYPDEKRLAGYEAARRCDIERTKSLLSDAWPQVAV